MNLSNVVTIKAYGDKDTVSTLTRLLEMAKNGQIGGMVYALKLSEWNHAVGITDDYRADPCSGIAATGRIFEVLNAEARLRGCD